MLGTQATTLVGVFEDWQPAQQAVHDLRLAGFVEDKIGIMARGGEHWHEDLSDEGSLEEGALAGAFGGASVGTLWAVGIAAGLMPVLGPVIAGGTLISVLAGGVGGAVLGGLGGALIGMGLPEEDARFYEEELMSGRTLVTVRTADRQNEAAAILRRHGAYNVESCLIAAGVS